MDFGQSTFELIGRIVVLGAVIWVYLAVISRLLYRRAVGLPIFGNSVYHAVPYVPEEEALRVAGERREKITTFLRDFRRTEFIENPPQIEPVQSRNLEGSDGAWSWHLAHLQWQLQGNHYLLAERVVDALMHLESQLNLTDERIASSVSIAPIGARLKEGKFPWRVIVATNYIDEVGRKLSPLCEWIGVGVDLVRPTKIHAYGRCKIGRDAENGIVSGTIITPGGAEYGLTCLHILSSDCRSIYWPTPRTNGNSGYDYNYPDATLIDLSSNCFIGKGAVGHQVNTTKGGVRGMKVVKHPKRREGEVLCPILEFSVGTTMYRGPHFVIMPCFTRKFGLYWPLKSRRFSARGESGSWVMDQDSGSWVGMIVAGYEEPNKGSFAVRSDFLLNGLENYFNSGQPMIAKLFEAKEVIR